jgi:hypothetical protein
MMRLLCNNQRGKIPTISLEEAFLHKEKSKILFLYEEKLVTVSHVQLSPSLSPYHPWDTA